MSVLYLSAGKKKRRAILFPKLVRKRRFSQTYAEIGTPNLKKYYNRSHLERPVCPNFLLLSSQQFERSHLVIKKPPLSGRLCVS
jgi:hypothetical protein